jgi:peptidoglycan/LPS O-acetylase OafA/YrhL
MRHIPAIDGLRAVAVFAVVAYHAGLSVPAGFVGVDVFFVISGYLITRLLHDEIQATGRVDYLAFYARRARRILPALLVVVAFTALAAIWLLPYAESVRTTKAGNAALLFSANIFFSLSPTGYFDLTPESSPLLHLWSLGVEEQFYILWPAILVLARKRLVPALAILCVASFVLAEWWSGTNAAFYQTPARAWELGMGALVAVRPVRLPRGAAWVGLAAVLLACFVPLPRFPGVGALPAVAGAALLIAAIQNGQRSPLLELAPMQAIGRWSYSYYLWHWPLLVIVGPMIGKVPAGVLLPLAIAYLSYRFIETPARRSQWVPRTAVLAGVAAMLVGAWGLNMSVSYRHAPPAAPSVYAAGCDSFYHSADVNPCEFGRRDAPRTVVIMGDSVGLQWFPALHEIYRDWRIVVLTKSACPMVDEPVYYPRVNGIYTVCSQWRGKALEYANELRPDLVIIGSSNSYGFSQEEWSNGTRRVLRSMPYARQVRILRGTPILPNTFGLESHAAIQQAAAQFKNARVVDMTNLVCPKDCRPADYRDPTHLSAETVMRLAPSLKAKL